MLYPVCILTKDPGLAAEKIPGGWEKNIVITSIVDPASEADISKAYLWLNDNLKYRSSIVFNIILPLDELALDSILSFFFIPGYLHIHGQPAVWFTGPDQTLLSESAQTLLNRASKLGTRLPIIAFLYPDTTEENSRQSNKSNMQYFESPQKLASAYFEAIQSTRFFDRILFFYSPDGTGIDELINAIAKTDEAMKLKYPFLYEAISRVQVLTEENYYLRKKYELSNIESNNQQMHLAIMQSGRQSAELQEYYTREYEILPLWYKRFGHLLKVIMGKRTFRSLFNNNVKKYKV